MPPGNPFPDTYKDFSNARLLYILQNEAEYQPLAIEAARNELASRNLSPEETEAAKQELIQQKEIDDKKTEKLRAFSTKTRDFTQSIAETIRPSSGAPSAERILKAFCIIDIILFLVTSIRNYRSFGFSFEMAVRGDFGSLVVVIASIAEPVALILLWLKKRAGWFIFAIFLLVATLIFIGFTYVEITRERYRFHGLFPGPSYEYIIFQAAVFAGSCWVIFRKGTRDIFRISKSLMLKIVLITTGILILFWLLWY